jgi:hypothetical protein
VQKLPPIPDPKQYEGLFVYDFGDHVSVGYTAGEISVLRRAMAYHKGTAYQIYRVNERGGLELRGVQDAGLASREAICFLRADAAIARRDYESILSEAQSRPLPCDAELRLVRSYGFEPSDLTALIYPEWASHVVSGWLGMLIAPVGDQVHGGAQVLQKLESGGGINIETAALPSKMDYSDRTEQEVLSTTDRALQR